jgi:peptidoglycan/LPS O-acetylase OafA/YrhL
MLSKRAAGGFYFPNLDGLRFVAFLFILFSHVYAVQLPDMQDTHFTLCIRGIAQNGALSLNFFFILSGFLITYLLFNEKNKTGKISITNYYRRRILRIWPLYFFMLLLGFILIPFISRSEGFHYTETAQPVWFVFFIANFYLLQKGPVFSPALATLWSISVEEQFYLIWPWLLRAAKKNFPAACWMIILVSVVFRILHAEQHAILYFHTLSIVSDFGAGGLLAFYASAQPKWFNRLQQLPKHFIVSIYMILIICFILYNYIFHSPAANALERIAVAASFLFILFEQNYCLHSFYKVGASRLISYLGQITFGLYCYHEYAIILAKNILLHFNNFNSEIGHLVFFPLLALIIDIPIAVLSYHTFELFFLRLKKKYSAPAF